MCNNRGGTQRRLCRVEDIGGQDAVPLNAMKISIIFFADQSYCFREADSCETGTLTGKSTTDFLKSSVSQVDVL